MSKTVPEVKEMPKKKLLTCQICGKTDENVDMWIGGYLNEAHHECADYAAKAIELYLLWLDSSFHGARNFADHLMKVLKKHDRLVELPDLEASE
jgi:hypothetical protein